ncbi:MAG: ethanolamine utilization protein EutN [Deltaproteobacteria bacterium RIFOXYA12_FULL_61_11]|nr:MAG: ethanolamine utilization protein EutN [Deltaproteobacteria bacterium RIFOXYA12_FULL_61_11]
MELGKVLGTCVCTQKYEGLEGIKLLVMQPLDHHLAPTGDPLVVCDSMLSGPGDIVYWVKGREAALALPVQFVPVDATITGIVDRVNAHDPG